MKSHNAGQRYQLETQAIHAGEADDALGAHVAPIYQTSTYTFPDMKSVDAVVAGDVDGFMYSRSKNPSRRALALKIAELEGHDLVEAAHARGQQGQVVAAEVFSSGMAAVSAAILGMAKAGQHVIAQDVLYGSSEHLISEVLPQYGISTSFARDLDQSSLALALEEHPNTSVIYLETPANPTMTLVDIAAVCELAHAHGTRVIVDNTFASPMLQRPLTLGADVVVHSTTKYLSGHGVVIGGAVISRDVELMTEHIATLIRFLGGVPSPFDCWLTNLGIKTMPLRMQRHCDNALSVARFLEQHDKIAAVHYPGLESFPQAELARRQMHDFGAMMAFEVEGGQAAARRLLDGVRLCSLAVSLGNVDTLIEHPASMTHSIMPSELRAARGISDGLIRLSVGLEAVKDIIGDLDQALDRI